MSTVTEDREARLAGIFKKVSKQGACAACGSTRRPTARTIELQDSPRVAPQAWSLCSTCVPLLDSSKHDPTLVLAAHLLGVPVSGWVQEAVRIVGFTLYCNVQDADRSKGVKAPWSFADLAALKSVYEDLSKPEAPVHAPEGQWCWCCGNTATELTEVYIGSTKRTECGACARFSTVPNLRAAALAEFFRLPHELAVELDRQLGASSPADQPWGFVDRERVAEWAAEVRAQLAEPGLPRFVRSAQ